MHLHKHSDTGKLFRLKGVSKLILTTIFLCAFLLLMTTGVAAAPAGSLDTTFGTGGIASIANDGTFETVVVQPDGKIVIGGTWFNEFGLIRFNSNGSIDTSFGTGGTVKTRIFTNSFGANLHDLAVQPDGKIIAVGYAHRWVSIPQKPGLEHFYEFATVRYNPNGSLDTTFDGDGIAITSLNPFRAGGGETVALQPDGKIVVAANFQGGYSFFTIFRYNPNGSPDTSFDGDGIAYVSAGSTQVATVDVKIQSDGKIVFAGTNVPGFQQNQSFYTARLNSDGSSDNSFDGDGQVITNINGHDIPYGLALQPDGKIIVAGRASPDYNSNPANFALVRYNPNGSLDSTFDGDGRVSTSLGNSTVAFDVLVQNDGKIVAGGWALNPASNDITVARYLPNGALDTSFDGNGVAFTDIENRSDIAYAVALQADGKILVGGTSGTSGQNFVVARYNARSFPIFDFDGDSKTDISIFRPSNGQWWLNRSSAGGYSIAFGNSSDKITPADFTGDGKTDIAFWRPSTGEWFVIRSEDGSYFSHPFGTNGDIPTPGDFDGDGKADEAVFRPSTSIWYILRSSGGVTIQQFGANGDVPVVGDYDGDAKADIAIFRPSTGDWWIQRSTAGQLAFQFGTSSDKQVQGDFTGDGKTDAAFYRPSTGFWYVLRSENYSFYSFPFGTAGDIPAPGDYDGDGQFDAAVFRPSGGTWYVRRSTAGVLIQNFGVNGDLPVPSAFVP
jgi:uncharacterized delta-60 repeat protein